MRTTSATTLSGIEGTGFAEPTRPTDAPAPAPAAARPDTRTRDRVLAYVLEHGPVTAAALAELLDLTPAAVRRHLDGLVEDGDIAPAGEGVAARRGRGRPARAYVVTPRGHRRLDSDDAGVAVSALRFMAQRLGPEAVEAFARERFAGLEERYRGVVEGAGPDVRDRVEALASALAADGFAARTRPLGAANPLDGVQLCQGHCPMHRIASEFPQFCDAETDVFARLLGVHVQRLATLARGEHVCTTFVPHLSVRPGAATPTAPTAPDPPGAPPASADPPDPPQNPPDSFPDPPAPRQHLHRPNERTPR